MSMKILAFALCAPLLAPLLAAQCTQDAPGALRFTCMVPSQAQRSLPAPSMLITKSTVMQRYPWGGLWWWPKDFKDGDTEFWCGYAEPLEHDTAPPGATWEAAARNDKDSSPNARYFHTKKAAVEYVERWCK